MALKSDNLFFFETLQRYEVMWSLRTKEVILQFQQAPMPNTPLIEFFQGSPPGIPFDITGMASPYASARQAYRMPPGTPTPVEGKVGLPPGPGFGLAIAEEWLQPLD